MDCLHICPDRKCSSHLTEKQKLLNDNTELVKWPAYCSDGLRFNLFINENTTVLWNLEPWAQKSSETATAVRCALQGSMFNGSEVPSAHFYSKDFAMKLHETKVLEFFKYSVANLGFLSTDGS